MNRLVRASLAFIAATGVLLVPLLWFGPIVVVPAAVATGALVTLITVRPVSDLMLAFGTVLASLVSIGASIVMVMTGQSGDNADGAFSMWEVAVLLALLCILARWGTGIAAVLGAALLTLAEAMWLVRFIPDVGTGGIALWSLAALLAAGVGGYPRLAERRTRRRIAQAAQQQRRQLERDLHDYVAHDVSGILAQAQAARFARLDDPAIVKRTLEDIEASAERALATMDRTVRLLRADGETAPRRPILRPGLAELPDAVAAFALTVHGRVTLKVDLEPSEIPDPSGELVHRVVIEALTNVRRHAARAHHIDVVVDRRDEAIRATVTDDGAVLQPSRKRSDRTGTGLSEVALTAASVLGEVRYGPTASGWRVELTLPLAEAAV